MSAESRAGYGPGPETQAPGRGKGPAPAPSSGRFGDERFWASPFGEALAAAGIAFLLTLPLVGLRTVDSPGGLGLVPRLNEVAVTVALVFAGRLALSVARAGWPASVLLAAVLALPLIQLAPFPTLPLQVLAGLGALLVALRAAFHLISLKADRLASLPSAQAIRAGWITTRARLRSGPIGLAAGGWFGPRAGGWMGPAAVLAAAAMPLTPYADRHMVDIGILLLTYIMLGWGLNIIVGLAGLLDLGYVAFYAVGAYAYALSAQYLGISFWQCLPLTGLLAACGGLALGFPVLRLRGDYFAIVTLGFGEIIRVVLINWGQFTGGPNGLSGIPRPSFFGLAEFARTPDPNGLPAFHELFGLEYNSMHRIIFLYYIILVLALTVHLFSVRIRRLPIGRAWEALREDDIACAALGINRTTIKLAAFALSASIGGLAGAFFATRQGFISPESFTFIESAIILAIVVLGGLGSQLGVVIATVVVIGLPEWFRELAQYRMLVFGAGMVLIMLWRPRGLLSHREPTIRLHDGRRHDGRLHDGETRDRLPGPDARAAGTEQAA